MKRFLDTSYLIHHTEDSFSDFFIISSQTLIELDNIKHSITKGSDIKYKARVVYRMLNEHEDRYLVINTNNQILSIIDEYQIPKTPDAIIVATAKKLQCEGIDIVFYTEDILCRLLARDIFSLDVFIPDSNSPSLYLGYKTVDIQEDELAKFYEDMTVNHFNCIENEYVIINSDGVMVDCLKWADGAYHSLVIKPFKSRMLGAIKPLDVYQKFAFDSIHTNYITVLYGRAGSGKTTIPLSYIMQGLETQKFRKCHIVYHYEPLRGAKTLGFEKGDHVTKLLNTAAIGNILESKVGDISTVCNMLAAGTLNIIPTANIRGVEFGESDIVLVTEVQNIDTYTLKTIIQRCKSGCKQIYEGDILEQRDIDRSDIGISRMIDVFKGHKGFGCVKLKKNYRSELSELADKM